MNQRSHPFPSYETFYDKKMDDKQMAKRHLQQYIYLKEEKKKLLNRTMRQLEIDFEQVWKDMIDLLLEEIETLADRELIQHIKQLDIYKSFLKDSMMRVDFQPGEPAYDEMTPA